MAEELKYREITEKIIGASGDVHLTQGLNYLKGVQIGGRIVNQFPII